MNRLANPVVFLEHDHVVTVTSRGESGCHARRAAADDEKVGV